MKAFYAACAATAVVGCLVLAQTALAQIPEPTAIKYPDATASPAVKAAFTQALEKCQAELREDYANKMAKAVADGKPHLVPVYERRREAALVELCQLMADNAAADQRIAANRADIAAADQRIAASEAVSAAYREAKRVADKINSGKETPKDIADLQVAYQYLYTVNAEKPDLGTQLGIKEVLSLIEPVLAKYKRLQSLK